MTYSVNEIETLAQKAARGAGAHPAQAAHFGRAATRHLAANRSPEDLAAALAALPGGPIQTMPFAPDNTPLGTSYRDTGPLPARLECPNALHAYLSDLAHKTYVPATEASRHSGAGAGLNDND